jgi:hypothetical protein
VVREKLEDNFRKCLLETLSSVSIRYEKDFPNIPIGAICSGDFLISERFQKAGLERFFKRIGTECLLFKSIPEVETHVASANYTHPYYELEYRCNEKD